MNSNDSTSENPQSVDDQNPPKRDHRQEVTDSIINMLEQGVAPWQKPWQGIGIPLNPTTEKAYRGGNAVHLLATAIQRGYEDARWMTYKQAAENDWQVKKGEKGTRIEATARIGNRFRRGRRERCHLCPQRRKLRLLRLLVPQVWVACRRTTAYRHQMGQHVHCLFRQ
jgi:N-terminal domain of anti-restriction factor ArdC